MTSNQINWELIINNMNHDLIRSFATGNISGDDFYQEARYDGVSPEVRRLLRSRGVTEARSLARKALRRRGVKV